MNFGGKMRRNNAKTTARRRRNLSSSSSPPQASSSSDSSAGSSGSGGNTNGNDDDEDEAVRSTQPQPLSAPPQPQTLHQLPMHNEHQRRDFASSIKRAVREREQRVHRLALEQVETKSIECSDTTSTLTSQQTSGTSDTSLNTSTHNANMRDRRDGARGHKSSKQQAQVVDMTSSESGTGSSSSSSELGSVYDVRLAATDNRAQHSKRAQQTQPTQQVISSAASVKRYKNSPFGLTRHYLTMPEADPNVVQATTAATNAIAYSGEEDIDGADSNLAEDDDDDAEQSRAMRKERARQRRAERRANATHRNAPSASSADRASSLSGADGQVPSSSLLTTSNDGGLDAPKCNAKNRQKCAAAAAAAAVDGSVCVDDACEPDGSTPGPMSAAERQHHLEKLKLEGELTRLESSGLLVRFSSIMYATFLVILGCILHVSELRQKSKNSSDHIYTTIVALIGIVWLLFLQIDLQRYKRYASRYILRPEAYTNRGEFSRAPLDSRRKFKNAHDHLTRNAATPATRSTTSSSASLVNSLNTEVIFKKTAYQMYQHRAALHKSQRARAGVVASPETVMQAHPNERDFDKPTRLKSDDSDDCLAQFAAAAAAGDHHALKRKLKMKRHANLVPAYKFTHGKMGASFYLKCGMAAFCFGHVIHEGLRFGQQVYFFGAGNVQCRDSAALVAHLVTPLYSFYQLFMMFKYSNLVINRHKILARFGLMHIVGTSVTFWIRTILEEAFEDFVHKMDYFKTHPKKRPAAATTNASPSAQSPGGSTAKQQDSNLMTLLTSISDVVKNEAMDRSDWTVASSALPAATNDSKVNSLLSLMSSPISATITPRMAKHLPDSYACAQNTLLTTKSMNALPYLYPFTIEYNLLLAAMFLGLYRNIGKVGLHGSNATCKPAFYNYKAAAAASHAQAGAHNIKIPSSLPRVYGDAVDMHNNHNQHHLAVVARSSGSQLSGSSASSLIGEHRSASASSSASSSSVLSHHPYEGGYADSHYPASNPGYNHHHDRVDAAAAAAAAASDMHEQNSLGEYKSNFVVNADCHSANKGLFCGFFVLLVTLVTIVIFFVTINKPSHVQLGIKINLIQEATLTILILIVTLAGFKQVWKLNKSPYLKDKVTTDDVLMLIPLPFFFIHSMLAFRAETATMTWWSSSSSVSVDAVASVGAGGGAGAFSGSQWTGGMPIKSASVPTVLQQRVEAAADASKQRPSSLGVQTTMIQQSQNATSRLNANNSNLLAARPSLNNFDNSSSSSSGSSSGSRAGRGGGGGGSTGSGSSRMGMARNGTHTGSSVENIISGTRTRSVSVNDDDGRFSNRSRSSSGLINSGVVFDKSGSSVAGGDRRTNGTPMASALKIEPGGGGNNRNPGVVFDNSNDDIIVDPNSSQSSRDNFKFVTVALNLIVLLEVILQTNFIIDGMRRCSESRYLRFKKPGRELITFAIILNITYWIVATFETKSVEQYKTEIEYYGPLPYMFISHTTLPVMLFYRYHSSVCLAEIWNRAYKPPKKR